MHKVSLNISTVKHHKSMSRSKNPKVSPIQVHIYVRVASKNRRLAYIATIESGVSKLATFKKWKVALYNVDTDFKSFQRNNAWLPHYLKHRLHLLILKACLASVLYKCTHHSALWVFDNGVSCVKSPTCCFMTFFAIGAASLLVLAEKAEEMAISDRGKRQATIFFYITCIHKWWVR